MDIVGFLKTKIAPLLKAKDSPQRVALAVSVGLFIGLTPTVGVQMAMVVLIAAIPRVRFNIPIACAMVWISNPFTMIPLYYGMYWLGVVFLNRHDMTFAKFKTLFQKLVDAVKEGDGFLESFWQGLTGVFSIGMDIAIPMWIGGLVMGLFVAIPSYFVTLYLYKQHKVVKERRAEKRSLQKTIVDKPEK